MQQEMQQKEKAKQRRARHHSESDCDQWLLPALALATESQELARRALETRGTLQKTMRRKAVKGPVRLQWPIQVETVCLDLLPPPAG